METKYSIKKARDEINVPTHIRNYDYNLEVEVGTTGYDSGVACKTYIRLTDLGGTDMKVNVIRDGYDNVETIELFFDGEHELRNIVKSSKFIHKTLKQLIELAKDVDKRDYIASDENEDSDIDVSDEGAEKGDREPLPWDDVLNNLLHENKSERMQLLVRPSVKEGFRKIAEKHGYSMNELINKIIEDYLDLNDVNY